MRLTKDEATGRLPGLAVLGDPHLGGLALGTTLDLWEVAHVRAVAGRSTVTCLGTSAQQDPAGDAHPLVMALRAGLEAAGAPAVGIDLHLESQVPRFAGLGEHATLTVLGLQLAADLLGEPSAARKIGPTNTAPTEASAEAVPDSAFDPAAFLASAAGPRVDRTGDLARSLGVDPLELALLTAGESLLRVGNGVIVPLSTAQRGSDLRGTGPVSGASPVATGSPALTAFVPGSPAQRARMLDPANEDLRADPVGDPGAQLADWLATKDVAAARVATGPTVLAFGRVPRPVVAAAESSGWQVLPV